MSSRSATVLAIFVVAIIAFCLACVFASITGPISILPNESDSSGSLDNFSNSTYDTEDTYDNQYYDDYSYSNSYSYQDYSNVETTTDSSSSPDVETTSDSSGDSTSDTNNPSKSPSTEGVHD